MTALCCCVWTWPASCRTGYCRRRGHQASSSPTAIMDATMSMTWKTCLSLPVLTAAGRGVRLVMKHGNRNLLSTPSPLAGNAECFIVTLATRKHNHRLKMMDRHKHAKCFIRHGMHCLLLISWMLQLWKPDFLASRLNIHLSECMCVYAYVHVFICNSLPCLECTISTFWTKEVSSQPSKRVTKNTHSKLSELHGFFSMTFWSRAIFLCILTWTELSKWTFLDSLIFHPDCSWKDIASCNTSALMGKGLNTCPAKLWRFLKEILCTWILYILSFG